MYLSEQLQFMTKEDTHINHQQAALECSREGGAAAARAMTMDRQAGPGVLPRPGERCPHRLEAGPHSAPGVRRAQHPSTLPRGLPSPSRAPALSSSLLPNVASLLSSGCTPIVTVFQALPPASSWWSSVLGEGADMRSKGEGKAILPQKDQAEGERAQGGG